MKDKLQLGAKGDVAEEFRELCVDWAVWRASGRRCLKRAIHLIICHTKCLRDHVPIRRAWASKEGEDMKILPRGLKTAASDGEKLALINPF